MHFGSLGIYPDVFSEVGENFSWKSKRSLFLGLSLSHKTLLWRLFKTFVLASTSACVTILSRDRNVISCTWQKHENYIRIISNGIHQGKKLYIFILKFISHDRSYKNGVISFDICMSLYVYKICIVQLFYKGNSTECLKSIASAYVVHMKNAQWFDVLRCLYKYFLLYSVKWSVIVKQVF